MPFGFPLVFIDVSAHQTDGNQINSHKCTASHTHAGYPCLRISEIQTIWRKNETLQIAVHEKNIGLRHDFFKCTDGMMQVLVVWLQLVCSLHNVYNQQHQVVIRCDKHVLTTCSQVWHMLRIRFTVIFPDARCPIFHLQW